jgi:hypothetical protein
VVCELCVRGFCFVSVVLGVSSVVLMCVWCEFGVCRVGVCCVCVWCVLSARAGCVAPSLDHSNMNSADHIPVRP